jgi:hypothetical protein
MQRSLAFGAAADLRLMVDLFASPDPAPGFSDSPRDRLEFWVGFGFGAFFGIVFSGLLWLRYFYQMEFGWLTIPISSLFCAFAVAHYGDNIWMSLRDSNWLRWW